MALSPKYACRTEDGIPAGIVSSPSDRQSSTDAATKALLVRALTRQARGRECEREVGWEAGHEPPVNLHPTTAHSADRDEIGAECPKTTTVAITILNNIPRIVVVVLMVLQKISKVVEDGGEGRIELEEKVEIEWIQEYFGLEFSQSSRIECD